MYRILAEMLPRGLVLWAYRRVISEAVHAEYRTTPLSELKATDPCDRWQKTLGRARRVPRSGPTPAPEARTERNPGHNAATSTEG